MSALSGAFCYKRGRLIRLVQRLTIVEFVAIGTSVKALELLDGEVTMHQIETVNWEALSNLSFVYEDNCWQGCKADCCQSELPDANFKFIKNPGTWIFYMPEEYKYYKNLGKVPSLNRSSSDLRDVHITLTNGLKISGFWCHCEYEGLCRKDIEPPLLCKLVPFLPVMNIDGKLESISMINFLDTTISAMGFDERCSVLNKKEKYLTLWRNNPDLIEPLRHPYILFYLMATNQLIENYKETLLNHPVLGQKNGTAFWNAWEIEYVTGRLFDKPKAMSTLQRLYEKFTKKYDGFCLS
jgi:hypothetical protein